MVPNILQRSNPVLIPTRIDTSKWDSDESMVDPTVGSNAITLRFPLEAPSFLPMPSILNPYHRDIIASFNNGVGMDNKMPLFSLEKRNMVVHDSFFRSAPTYISFKSFPIVSKMYPDVVPNDDVGVGLGFDFDINLNKELEIFNDGDLPLAVPPNTPRITAFECDSTPELLSFRSYTSLESALNAVSFWDSLESTGDSFSSTNDFKSSSIGDVDFEALESEKITSFALDDPEDCNLVFDAADISDTYNRPPSHLPASCADDKESPGAKSTELVNTKSKLPDILMVVAEESQVDENEMATEAGVKTERAPFCARRQSHRSHYAIFTL